jgi:hypothetical protein
MAIQILFTAYNAQSICTANKVRYVRKRNGVVLGGVAPVRVSPDIRIRIARSRESLCETAM